MTDVLDSPMARSVLGVVATIVAIIGGGYAGVLIAEGDFLGVLFAFLSVVNITIAVAQYDYVTNGET